MLEAKELLDRLTGHPNPTATEVRILGTQYRIIIDRMLAGQKSIDFLIHEEPTEGEFKFGWVWPYYQDLKRPIEIQASRHMFGKTVLEVRSDQRPYILEVRIEHKGNYPVLLNRTNLSYRYFSFDYGGDSWGRRKEWLQFGIDLANFAARHKPAA